MKRVTLINTGSTDLLIGVAGMEAKHDFKVGETRILDIDENKSMFEISGEGLYTVDGEECEVKDGSTHAL